MLAEAVPAGFGPASLLAEWRPEAFTPALAFLAGWGYAAGMRRTARRGERVARARAAAFFAGLAALLLALVSPIDAYAEALLSVHMAQHLLLSLVAVPLLALGAPISLALRASTPERARRLSRVLRSRPVALLVHPAVGWGAFVGATYAVHFSGLYQVALQSRALHLGEHTLFVGSAALFWWPIVGADPTPRPLAHPVRLLSMLLTMPAMSFAALAIYSADAPLYAWYGSLPAPWGPAALGDQRTAAVMMWLVGNLAMVVAILLVAAAWRRSEEARQRRLEDRLDRAPVLPGEPP